MRNRIHRIPAPNGAAWVEETFFAGFVAKFWPHGEEFYFVEEVGYFASLEEALEALRQRIGA